MTRFALFAAILIFVPSSTGQQPAKNSEAAMTGLHGHVHTVLTETLDGLGNPDNSKLEIYDPDGYLLEDYRYEPDGSLRSHIRYTRKSSQVFKTETISSDPSENRTFVQSFNSDGLVTGTETYDGKGSLLGETKNDTAQGKSGGGGTVSTSKDVKPDGTVSSIVTDEKTNATGLSQQSAIKDGKPYYNWLVQRDANGKPVADVFKFADGSFNEREVTTDGTTIEHKYWAPTKTDTYQITDANNRVIEVIEDSPTYYVKITYRYDGAGRQIEIANYDRSGKLLRKGITKYQEDGNGNWIEQRDYYWEAALGNKPLKASLVNRRTITYY
jgi:hypothetical protein